MGNMKFMGKNYNFVENCMVDVNRLNYYVEEHELNEEFMKI